MARETLAITIPGIAALEPTTARQISSGQILVDPSSVIKELIDNALDARAKSICVDITTNTIDAIQVRDDGHGIPAMDRALLCRRYCTSKIRDYGDLKEIGGRWLGFRGEALACIAELSGTLAVTTRVEGEPIAVKLKYGRNGELMLTERDSHPIGTSVKATGIFEHIPVRKQVTSLNSTKCLSNIRRLMQAYALARPAVRLRLRILKAKNSRGDFIYAPKTDADVVDAAMKVLGKECASQCDWTSSETNGYEIQAMLPKHTAIGAKISNHGAFICIDSRPVSCHRGTMKKILACFMDSFRKSNSSLATVKAPFLYMNIVCPPGSYDPNIEPAKDDVIFEDNKLIIEAVETLLSSYYPKTAMDLTVVEPPTSAQPPNRSEAESVTHNERVCTPVQKSSSTKVAGQPAVGAPIEPMQWKPDMYSTDLEDQETQQELPDPVTEQIEELRAVEISNPWTIARMNAAPKSRTSLVNGQLLSPAKSQCEPSIGSSSPLTGSPSQQPCSRDPLTPQASQETYNFKHSTSCAPERSIPNVEKHPSIQHYSEYTNQQHLEGNHVPAISSIKHSSRRLHAQPFESKKHQINNEDLFFDIAHSSDTQIAQLLSVPENSQPHRCQKNKRQQDVQLCSHDPLTFSQERDSAAGKRLTVDRRYLENHADIRDYFQPKSKQSGKSCGPYNLRSRFTPINPRTSSNQPRRGISPVADGGRSFFPHKDLQHPPSHDSAGERSGELRSPSSYAMDEYLINYGHGARLRLPDMKEQLRAYAERKAHPQASSTGSISSMCLNAKTGLVPVGNQIFSSNGACKDQRGMLRQFQNYDNHLLALTAPRSAHSLEETLKNVPQNQNNLATAANRILHAKSYMGDGLERSRSSKLPLERIPHEYRTHNIMLPKMTNLAIFVQISHQLDMVFNSLEWTCPVRDAIDAFAEPSPSCRSKKWAATLDDILRKSWEKIRGVDTRHELLEGIQKAFNARKGLGKTMEILEMTTDVIDSVPRKSACETNNIKVAKDVIYPYVVEQAQSADDGISDFDMSQFVDLDTEEPVTTMSKSDDKTLTQIDESLQEIDDDMLMDL